MLANHNQVVFLIILESELAGDPIHGPTWKDSGFRPYPGVYRLGAGHFPVAPKYHEHIELAERSITAADIEWGHKH